MLLFTAAFLRSVQLLFPVYRLCLPFSLSVAIVAGGRLQKSTRGRMHNNVLVYAEISGYIRSNKSETHRQLVGMQKDGVVVRLASPGVVDVG